MKVEIVTDHLDVLFICQMLLGNTSGQSRFKLSLPLFKGLLIRKRLVSSPDYWVILCLMSTFIICNQIIIKNISYFPCQKCYNLIFVSVKTIPQPGETHTSL